MTTKKKAVKKKAPEDGLIVNRGVIESYEKRIADLKEQMTHMVEMELSYQPYISYLPRQDGVQGLYKQACSGDDITIKSWKDKWLAHVKENGKNYSFSDKCVSHLSGKNAFGPGIIAGSGPSLKKNVDELAKNKPDNIPLVSCLHNYAFFEDHGVNTEYFVNLDAGDVTIDEMSQGGKKSADYYWDSTKDKTLIAGVVSKPELLKRWKGEIYFFTTVVPEKEIMDSSISGGKLPACFNVGGTTLGACLYHAAAILGCEPIAFVGADFCFSYTKKFHPFDSPYDSQFAGLMPAVDVYGNRVYTWASYANFAAWFLFMAYGGQGNNPITMINCTEGGIFGAFPEGNVNQIRQITLHDFLFAYNKHRNLSGLLEKHVNTPAFLF